MKNMNTSGKQPEIIAPKVPQHELAPAGPNPATLLEVVDSGMMTFGDKTRHMITLIWATDALDSHGEPFLVYDMVHLTVHHLGNLASRIEAITGALPSEDEPYPVHTLRDGRALLQIKHRKTEKGTYANVDASFPIGPMKAQAVA
jgi:hypothetical protein